MKIVIKAKKTEERDMTTKFNISKKGYDMEEVDSYIKTLETVIKSYKEKDSATNCS
jgi:hypothetical protein